MVPQRIPALRFVRDTHVLIRDWLFIGLRQASNASGRNIFKRKGGNTSIESHGGGIDNHGTSILSNSTISNNASSSSGGGIRWEVIVHL